MATDDTEATRVKRWRQGSKVRPANGQVHVWRMQFSSTNYAKQAWALMSEQERARASSFHFRPDCERFCMSRLLVRCVLGRYLDLDPAKVVIIQGPNYETVSPSRMSVGVASLRGCSSAHLPTSTNSTALCDRRTFSTSSQVRQIGSLWAK